MTQALQHLPRCFAYLPVIIMYECWQRLDGATVGRISGPVRERCEKAVKRRDQLNRLRAIDPYLPLDEQDGQWLALWDAPLLKDCADAAPLWPWSCIVVLQSGCVFVERGKR